MSRKARIISGEFAEFLVPATEYAIAQLVVEFTVSLLAQIGNESINKPRGQIQQNSVLNDFLQIAPKNHVIDENLSDSFSDLNAQILVIAIEIHEKLIADDLRSATCIIDGFIAYGKVALVVI